MEKKGKKGDRGKKGTGKKGDRQIILNDTKSPNGGVSMGHVMESLVQMIAFCFSKGYG